MENKNENKKTNTEITEELIYKCEKTRKNNSKKDKPLTDNDIMKYEIASELSSLSTTWISAWANRGFHRVFTSVSPPRSSIRR